MEFDFQRPLEEVQDYIDQSRNVKGRGKRKSYLPKFLRELAYSVQKKQSPSRYVKNVKNVKNNKRKRNEHSSSGDDDDDNDSSNEAESDKEDTHEKEERLHDKHHKHGSHRSHEPHEPRIKDKDKIDIMKKFVGQDKITANNGASGSVISSKDDVSPSDITDKVTANPIHYADTVSSTISKEAVENIKISQKADPSQWSNISDVSIPGLYVPHALPNEDVESGAFGTKHAIAAAQAKLARLQIRSTSGSGSSSGSSGSFGSTNAAANAANAANTATNQNTRVIVEDVSNTSQIEQQAVWTNPYDDDLEEEYARFQLIRAREIEFLKLHDPLDVLNEDPSSSSFCLGDIIYEKAMQLLDMFPGKRRSPDQVAFHNAIFQTCLPHIYKEDFQQSRTVLLNKLKRESFNMAALVMTPRRFGKTTAVAMAAAVLMYVCRGINIVIFSTTQDMSSKMMDKIIEFFYQLEGGVDRICTEKKGTFTVTQFGSNPTMSNRELERRGLVNRLLARSGSVRCK
jgi:hypothetical protein